MHHYTGSLPHKQGFLLTQRMYYSYIPRVYIRSALAIIYRAIACMHQRPDSLAIDQVKSREVLTLEYRNGWTSLL